jgi:proline dehydrogenase
MSLMRSTLLAISDNRWMRRNAPKVWFIRKAVRRFMPGERAEDALAAGAALVSDGIHVILTQLGENIAELAEADAVTEHYLTVIDAIAARGLPGQVSIKPTQMGLDIDAARCLANVRRLAARAQAHGQYLWIDMEQHGYVDATLDLYRALRAEFPRVGVCLQAYLYRTPQDLEAIIAMGGGVRLVKGAYREPASVAFPKKADVDAAYLTLAKRMLDADARAAGFDAVFGTHDQAIVAAIRAHAAATGVSCDGYEFALLYGINRAVQHDLAAAGCRVRVLISYGEFWFPWYMRRLAERPANVWFVVRTMFAR